MRGEPDGRDEKEKVAEDGDERAGGMLQYPIPVVNGQLDIGNIGDWQHFHIGNIHSHSAESS